MTNNGPSWFLNMTCPCCNQGSPELVVCRSCGHLAAGCSEVYSAFLDPRDLTAVVEEDRARCPRCGARFLDFIAPTLAQIEAAGFTRDQVYPWPAATGP